MKKLYGSILLLLLLYNLVGFMAGFSIVRAEWHEYVHSTLSQLTNSENIVSFKISKTQFDSAENELVKDGRYYDVMRFEYIGDSVKVYCFDDEKETLIVDRYNNILFENGIQKTDFQGKTHTIFLSFIKEYLFDKSFELNSTPPVFSINVASFFYKKPLLSSPFLDAESPPPQGILI
jgi:hypothetical protein